MHICTEAVLEQMPVPEDTEQGEHVVPHPPGASVLCRGETWQAIYKDNSERQVVKCNFRSHAGKKREKRDTEKTELFGTLECLIFHLF